MLLRLIIDAACAPAKRCARWSLKSTVSSVPFPLASGAMLKSSC